MLAAHQRRILGLLIVTGLASLACSPPLVQRVVFEAAVWGLSESVRAQQRQREQAAQLAREQALRREFDQKLAAVSRGAHPIVSENGTSGSAVHTNVYRPRPASPTAIAHSGAVRVASARPRAGAGAGVRLAKDVVIRMVSPAVGTAPHYVAFGVDLPTDVVQDADFLWMDNGMWICDEPRGVKILDTPGRHRISVLVVTPDGQEYRGTKDVVVLARVSDASRSNPRVGVN